MTTNPKSKRKEVAISVTNIAKTCVELEELGVIKIDKKGNIHQTKFGKEVYEYMKRKGML